ncbi:CHAD domain-containing protein [Methylotetracoccus oryzae]|uniref:CHAD domain-containing protein n=1 Tax=Methylotetracoccus oryzae TaxID=1919059 RepID=UPI001118857C|nr:CHAD domain-containing protein [Methylotetracoccus oryzae]
MTSERITEWVPAWPNGTPTAASTSVSQGQRSIIEATVLDTFDRRLFRRGQVCVLQRTGKGRGELQLWAAGAARARRSAIWASTAMPRFAWDLDDTDLRSELTPLIDVRALLPQCRLRRAFLTIPDFPEAVPDGVRLFRVRSTWIPETGRPRLLAERLAVCWDAPDDKLGRHFVNELLERGLIAPITEDIWQAALAAAGRLPPAEASGSYPGLAPELRTDVAARRVLAALFDLLTTNESGIVGAVDSEFLHDFRVAVRRSRVVLGQLKGAFPERSVARHVRDLAWLGEITGPVRDLDVYLLHFEDLQQQLPSELREDLVPLRTLLAREAAAAHAALVRSLGSSRYRRFKAEWPQWLARGAPRRPTAPNALAPIASVAGRRIWTLYRRVAKAAGTVDETTPSERIHELRKSCKKLRYLLEVVQPFHAKDRMRRPIKALKLLQDHLGAFQDAEVQREYLRGWFAQLRQDGEISSPTLLAVGMLFGRFEQLQAARRAEIPEALRHFARKEERARFKTLFKEQPTAAVGTTGRTHRAPARTEKEGETE